MKYFLFTLDVSITIIITFIYINSYFHICWFDYCKDPISGSMNSLVVFFGISIIYILEYFLLLGLKINKPYEFYWILFLSAISIIIPYIWLVFFDFIYINFFILTLIRAYRWFHIFTKNN